MSNIHQALLAVGGKASRLKASGVEVPISKSFLNVTGKPILFWNLCSLYQAGIRSLVIAGQDIASLQQAKRTLRNLPYSFDDVQYFQDFGWGMHGLPYQARYLLEKMFLFECGHGLSTPSHYRKLLRAKNSENIVFSAFIPHPDNTRQPVTLTDSRVKGLAKNVTKAFAIAHPLVIDQSYTKRLLDLDFDITRIINYYTDLGRLYYVMNDMPPEFDIAQEMIAAEPIYRSFAKHLGGTIDL